MVEIFLPPALAWPQLEHVPGHRSSESDAAAGECPGENGPKPQPGGTGAVC